MALDTHEVHSIEGLEATPGCVAGFDDHGALALPPSGCHVLVTDCGKVPVFFESAINDIARVCCVGRGRVVGLG